MGLERSQPLGGAGEIFLRDAGRELLIVAKKNEIRLDHADGSKEVIRIAENDVNLWKGLQQSCEALLLALLRYSSFDRPYIQIPRNDNMHLTAFACFSQDEVMTGMEHVESAEEENTEHEKASVAERLGLGLGRDKGRIVLTPTPTLAHPCCRLIENTCFSSMTKSWVSSGST